MVTFNGIKVLYIIMTIEANFLLQNPFSPQVDLLVANQVY